MSLQSFGFLLPHLVATAISAGVAVYSWHRRAGLAATSFALYASATAWMNLAYFFQLTSLALDTKLFWDGVQLVAVLLASTALLNYTRRFRDHTPLYSRNITWIVTMALIFWAAMIFSDPLHRLIRADPKVLQSGPLLTLTYTETLMAWAMVLYGDGLLLLGLREFGQYATSFQHSGRLRWIAILSGILISAIATVLDGMGVVSPLHLAFTPFAFGIGCLLVAWGVFRGRHPDVIAASREAVIGGLGDAALLLDAQNRIVQVNQAAQELIQQSAWQLVGQSIVEVFSDLPLAADLSDEKEATQATVVHDTSDGPRRLEVRISALRDDTGAIAGRLLTAHDITRQADAADELKEYRDFFHELVAERAVELRRSNERLQKEVTERKRIEVTIRTYAERLEILNQIEQAIRLARSPEQVVNAALDQIEQLIPCQRLSLTLFDLEAEEAIMFAATSSGETSADVGRRISLSDFSIPDSLHENKPYVVADIAALDSMSAIERQRLTEDGIHSYVNVPLIARDTLIGSLNLAATSPGYFDHEHVVIATEVAIQLAIALDQASLLQETQRRLKELTVLHAVAVATAEATNEEELIDRVAEIISDTLFPDVFGIMLLDADTGLLHPRPSLRGVTEDQNVWAFALGEGVVGAVAAEGTARRVPDTKLDPGTIPISPGTRSILCVPLKLGGKIFGVIIVESGRPEYYSKLDEQLLSTLARQLAMALERLRAQAVERRQAEQTAALLNTSRIISRSLGMSASLQAIADEVERLLQADGSRIHLIEPDGETLDCVIARHQGKAAKAEEVQLILSEGITGEVAATGKSRIVSAQQALQESGTRVSGGHAVEHLALVPLRMRGKVIGVMEVSRSKESQGFHDSDLNLLTVFATHAAIAISNAQLYSELELALEQEQNTRARLVQSAKLSAIGQLAASITHELSNPLQVIQGGIRLANDDEGLPPQTKEYLEIALSEAQRMGELIGRLRDTYRPVTKPKVQPVILNELVEEVQQLTEAHLRHNRIKYRPELAADMPIVPAVRDQLRQVILNLSLNAVEAMPAGGELITKTGSTKDGQEVWLAVTDTGTGIDAKDVPHIFDPFFTRKESGTGLGLAITHDIVERHEGRIDVRSEPGQGTTFTVWLPTEAARFNKILP